VSIEWSPQLPWLPLLVFLSKRWHSIAREGAVFNKAPTPNPSRL
jgi:hypothetical protein